MNRPTYTNGSSYHPFPYARSDASIVPQKVANEFIVYDLDTNKVYQLNRTAATVWQWCDGKTPPNEMAQRLSTAHGIPAEKTEPLLWLTLDRLEKANLLENKVIRPRNVESIDRRTLLRIMGGAAMLPVVYTILAPSAAHAQSGGICSSGQIVCANCGDCAFYSCDSGAPLSVWLCCCGSSATTCFCADTSPNTDAQGQCDAFCNSSVAYLERCVECGV